jgi:hypothetical protein
MKNKIAIKEMCKFDRWMRVKVKSIHYSNNLSMSEAYKKVYDNIASSSK